MTHDAPHRPPRTALAALTTVGGSRAHRRVDLAGNSIGDRNSFYLPELLNPRVPPAAAQTGVEAQRLLLRPQWLSGYRPPPRPLSAGLIARSLGNEQSLLVAWTAYVIIAGSGRGVGPASVGMARRNGSGGRRRRRDRGQCPGQHRVDLRRRAAIGVFFTIVTAPVLCIWRWCSG